MQWTDRIGRRIKLRDLHVLHAVAQAGSMTKAAGELAISVPVVSKATPPQNRVSEASIPVPGDVGASLTVCSNPSPGRCAPESLTSSGPVAAETTTRASAARGPTSATSS